MKNRTIEVDRDGRLTIYPSLFEPREKGLVRKIVRKIVDIIVKRRN